MRLRSITSTDWNEILVIQEECYPQIEPESLEVLQSKWRVSPQTCFVMESDNQVVGYCLAHPWVAGSPPALEQLLIATDRPDTLYLHDIALSSKAQGKGAGNLAFNALVEQARERNLPCISLVAVQGADSYWRRQGFVAHPIEKSLDSYTADACYMVLALND
ncbi:GNAT family N-acetyltransferase [uncultured Shewanella sp.]|uniref:GNAT family N-acetyltransferase n=1 Tax=Shewanella atlantica TaxID=271099 RepID=UPI00261F4408|nr:GNAT family N-acetyltransferase [uncultured Shewanella sp.]